MLFFGPLIAPLFQATQLPFVAGSGVLARDLLSRYICPTPAKSYALLGFPMAVCARCWGATIGLWAAWFLLGAQASGHRAQGGVRWRLATGNRPLVTTYLMLAWPLRLLVGALPFLLWVAEIRMWPAAPYWALLLNGAFAGFWAGLFFCSVWPGLLHNQDFRFSVRSNLLYDVFCPREGKKRHTIKIKYHAAAGKSTLSESPNNER